MSKASKPLLAALVIAGLLVLVAVKVTRSTAARGDVPPTPAGAATAAQPPSPEPAPAPPKLPRLVDLGAGKCVACKMMAPVLEELKREYEGRLVVEVLDVWETPEYADQYGVKTIPTQILYDASGKELYRHEGFLSKADILATFRAEGVKL